MPRRKIGADAVDGTLLVLPVSQRAVMSLRMEAPCPLTKHHARDVIPLHQKS